MKFRLKHITIAIGGLLSFFFILIPYWNYINTASQFSNQEQIIIEGHIKSLTYNEGFGKYSVPSVIFELNESSFTFRLIDNAYSASNPQLIAELDSGEYIYLTTTLEQIEKSTSKKAIDEFLNYMFKWHKQPLIYSIKTTDKTILTIEKYLNEKKNSNIDYIVLGIIVLAIYICIFLYVTFKERIKKRATTWYKTHLLRTL